MASVELRPGDTLNIVWTALQDTPLGEKKIESSFEFSYDDLMARLRTKGRAGKSRRSGTDGARFSRMVALASNALRKGKWSTGADIDRSEVFSKLIKRFNSLDAVEYKNITPNAKESLMALNQKADYLKSDEKAILAAVVKSMGLSK